jgi:Mrp family chromosome partitioning ATPase
MMRYYLDGTVPMSRHLVRTSDTLALGLNEMADDNPSETLQDPSTMMTLHKMRTTLQPDLVIYDMPPMLGHDDVSGFLPQLDGILLVSDGTQTMSRQLTECERILDDQVPLLGVVLNRARRNSITR